MLNIANISAILNKTLPYSTYQTSTVDAPHPCSTQSCIPQASSANQKALRSEALRRATFQGWPKPHPTPSALASAGFFYRGVADQTQCAFCYITISQWESQDSPIEEHKKHAMNCPFVLGLPVGNIPISVPSSDRSNGSSSSSLNITPSISSITIPALGGGGVDSCSRFLNEIRPNASPEQRPREAETSQPSSSASLSSLKLPPHQRACRPEFSSLEARMKTFADWPPGLAQRPAQLAEAGFYYMGTGDHVKCFCCDGALRNWEPKDNPWEEHARWFSRCNFLVSVKGSDYVKETLARYQQVLCHSFAEPSLVVLTEIPSQNPSGASDVAIDFRATEKKEEAKEGKESKESACETASNAVEKLSTEAKPAISQDALLCIICCDQKFSMVFLPCGHSCCCPSCATALTNCPLCRKRIEVSVPVYFPFSV